MNSFRTTVAGLLALSVVSIVWFESDPRLKYNLEDPIYHRLKQRIFSPAPARFDTAFIGSSHIWNAVDTELINQRLPQQYSYNFGVNWFGNDTKLVLVRDLLAHKPVGRIVLEITGGEDREHHQYFMFMATARDWARACRSAAAELRLADYLTLSPRFRTEAEHLAAVSLPFATKGLYFGFREYVWKTPPVPVQDHDGFLPVSSVYTFSDPSVNVSDSDDSRSDVRLTPWLVQIGQLCRKHHVELYFLFTPQRNESYPGPKFLAALREWGHPIVLDAHAYYQPGLWYNPTHLNTSGAKIFTEELLASELFSARLDRAGPNNHP